MKIKKNGWEKPRVLTSEYVRNNTTEANFLPYNKVLMIARTYCKGSKLSVDSISADDHRYFQKHVHAMIKNSKKPPVLAWPALDTLNKKIGEKRTAVTFVEATFPESSSIQPDILIALSQFVSRVGFEKLEEHFQVVKSIRSL